MKKADLQKPIGVVNESLKLDAAEEQKLLQELCELQMEAIEGFRLINEKVKYSALNVFLLQGLTESKALYEEINQLILIHLGESSILNSIKENANQSTKRLVTEIEKDDFIGLIENIKLFEEYTISYYQRVMDKPLSANARKVLQNQLDALHTRYHRLAVLEKKIKPE